MTAGELITKLQEFDPNMLVVVDCNFCGGLASHPQIIVENGYSHIHKDVIYMYSRCPYDPAWQSIAKVSSE